MLVLTRAVEMMSPDAKIFANAPSRVLRIARGSGTHPQLVLALVDQHKQMEKMMSGMGKAGLLKGGDEAMAAKLKRNPNAVMQAMQKSVDPGMLSKLGGMGNLMNLLKAGGGAGGGMPDIGELAPQHSLSAAARARARAQPHRSAARVCTVKTLTSSALSRRAAQEK